MNQDYTVKWSANAENDVLAIVSYIKVHSGPMTAANIYKRIKDRVKPLETFPVIDSRRNLEEIIYTKVVEGK